MPSNQHYQLYFQRENEKWTDFHGLHDFMAVIYCGRGDERHQQFLKISMGVAFNVLH